MNLIAELRSEIWYLFDEDEVLSELFGGEVDLYNTWADEDAKFPYLVHRMQEKPLPDGVITEIDYYLDIWDYDYDQKNLNMEKILEIRSRIVALLDRSVFIFNSGAIARFKYFSGGDIPEDARGIQHYATQWKVRVDRTADILAKLKE